MNLLPLTDLFSFNAKQKRDLELALNVLKTLNEKKFQSNYLLKFARRSKYNNTLLIRIARTSRTRRQKVLNGAYIQPLFHPFRSFRLFLAANIMQTQMEDLFRTIFRESGDEEFFETISQAQFVTEEYLSELRVERSRYIARTQERVPLLDSLAVQL